MALKLAAPDENRVAKTQDSETRTHLSSKGVIRPPERPFLDEKPTYQAVFLPWVINYLKVIREMGTRQESAADSVGKH
jgi:hypothetical protein